MRECDVPEIESVADILDVEVGYDAAGYHTIFVKWKDSAPKHYGKFTESVAKSIVALIIEEIGVPEFQKNRTKRKQT